MMAAVVAMVFGDIYLVVVVDNTGLPQNESIEQVLQVFVQETLATSYQTNSCAFNDPCE